MVTLDEALEHLGYEPADTDDAVRRNVARSLAAAEATLRGAVGDDLETYLPGDPRAAELTLAYLDELYDNRGIGAKTAAAVRHLIHSLEWQLKLELRQKREEAAGGDGA